MTIVGLIAIGAATGLLTGLTGASGVVIVVPALTLLLDTSVSEAVGTSLIVDVVAATAVTVGYARHGQVAWIRGSWLACGAIVGAQIGARLATSLPEDPYGVAFGIGVMVMGLVFWSRAGHERAETVREQLAPRERVAAIGLGLIIGFITGLSGAGGGLLVMAVLLGVLGLPIHLAIGTSGFVMALTALSGAIGIGNETDLSVTDGIVMGIAAVIAATLTSDAANRMRPRTLAAVATGVFFAMGVVMFGAYAGLA